MAEATARRNMRPGDQFHTHGYDLVASAQYAVEPGEAVVLNNNSTHYLVAVRMHDADELATLVESFMYNAGEHSARRAYREAVMRMAHVASTR